MVAFLTFTHPADSASMRVLQAREARQARSLNKHQGTLRFFRNHARLRDTRVGRREVRRSRIWVRIIRAELAETRAQLEPRVSALWTADAVCETGTNPPNWRFHVGVYQGGIAFWYGTWDAWKVNVPAARRFAEADQAPAWVQAQVAQWGLDRFGRWGCLLHPNVWAAA